MLFFSFLLLLGFDVNMPPIIESAIEHSIDDTRPVPNFDTIVFNDTLKSNVETNLDTLSYKDTKAGIDQLRKRLGEARRLGKISLDSIKSEFTTQLVDRIIPHWYGTPWSFGGHTAVPNQGEIACGYFISTTLRDMGIQLNRFKLAQKSPIDEAKVISCGSEIYSVAQDSPEKAFAEIDRITQEGIHFIGFDVGHVGYLLKSEGELFLIHSNYLSPGSVCIEPLKESRVFKSFSKFHLVDISNNDTLIQLWLDNGIVL
ncbi:hypothetical protein [Maribacter aestuarii]|uniref:hypothetical protein n=1 Tax=Maribacter aestuarii TaxID=1130723 RepID=UPI00248B0E51|nr:hypothetical protein [Maribacter aestuarii]